MRSGLYCDARASVVNGRMAVRRIRAGLVATRLRPGTGGRSAQYRFNSSAAAVSAPGMTERYFVTFWLECFSELCDAPIKRTGSLIDSVFDGEGEILRQTMNVMARDHTDFWHVELTSKTDSNSDFETDMSMDDKKDEIAT